MHVIKINEKRGHEFESEGGVNKRAKRKKEENGIII